MKRLAYLLLFCFLLSLGGFAYGGSFVEDKISIESRIGLTKSGFQKLLGHVSTKSKIRVDYYMDAFDGESLLLSEAYHPIKFRIKASTKKKKWQVAIKKVFESFHCGTIEVFSSTKKSIQGKMSDSQFRAYKSQFNQLLNSLNNPDRELRDNMQRFHSLNYSLIGGTARVLQDEIQGASHLITPVQIAEKRILKKDFSTQKGNIEVSLREVKDLGLNRSEHLSYELEIEPEDSSQWTNREVHDFACKTLRLHDLKPTDLTETRYQRRPETLQQLILARDILGL